MCVDNNSTNFNKTLNLFDAVAIVAGSMIGSGVFIVSADILRQVKSSWLLLLVWIIAGLMTILGALCYGEYAASIPEAGGQYIYLKKVWGKLVGFLYGWTLFLVIQTGTIAAVSVAFAKFLGVLLPGVSASNILIRWHGFGISTEQLAAICLIALLAFINSRGVKAGALVQNLFTSTKVIALTALILAGFLLGINFHIIHLNFSHAFITATTISPFTAVSVALVGALFSLDSWNNVTFVAAEIKKPEKNLPKALILGTGMVICLYLLLNLAYLFVLSIPQIQYAHDDIVGAAFMSAILGEMGKLVISVIILISAIGCVNGIILAGSRVFYAMANDGLFFKKLGILDPKTNVPLNALIIECIWASMLVMSGSYMQLLEYVIFAALLFYILTVSGLFIFRKKFPDIPRPYKAIGYPYSPIIYCILAFIVTLNLLIYKPAFSWIGLCLVLTGIPVYFVWNKIRQLNKVS